MKIIHMHTKEYFHLHFFIRMNSTIADCWSGKSGLSTHQTQCGTDFNRQTCLPAEPDLGKREEDAKLLGQGHSAVYSSTWRIVRSQ